MKVHEGYKKLFDLAKKNYRKAFSIAKKIPADQLDYQILIGFQKSNDSDVRNLAAELVMIHFLDRFGNESNESEENEDNILSLFRS